MRWTVPGYGTLECVVEGPLRYGHGFGYVGSYNFGGQWRGREVEGNGYFGWVDLLGQFG
ncbi:DUF6670 family protein [Nocardia sp. NPDC058176]|uniref:DUF6670 family protein n=1 Tax=Nocardia sp. NPDC058176 TaxID=3346368 RepID=UPI0036DC158A